MTESPFDDVRAALATDAPFSNLAEALPEIGRKLAAINQAQEDEFDARAAGLGPMIAAVTEHARALRAEGADAVDVYAGTFNFLTDLCADMDRRAVLVLMAAFAVHLAAKEDTE